MKLITSAMIFLSVIYMNFPESRILVAFLALWIIFIARINIKFLLANHLSISFLIILQYLLLFTGLISAIKNSDVELAAGIGVLFLLMVTTIFLIPNKFKKNTVDIIMSQSFIIHIIIVILPIVFLGITPAPYLGIFNNGNSFGIAAVTLFYLICNFMTNTIVKILIYGEKKVIELCFYMGMGVITFLLVILSGSRTSVISALVITIVCLMYILGVTFLKTNQRKFSKSLMIFTPLVIGFVALANVFSLQEKFYNIFIYKFQLKSNDILSDRGQIWSGTLEDGELFGHGRDYFLKYEHAAHNTFISLIGQYGWIPTILFVLIIGILIILSIKFLISNFYSKNALAPINIMIVFIMLSMGEGMLFKSPMLLAFILTGAIIQNSVNNYNSNGKTSANNI